MCEGEREGRDGGRAVESVVSGDCIVSSKAGDQVKLTRI